MQTTEELPKNIAPAGNTLRACKACGARVIVAYDGETPIMLDKTYKVYAFIYSATQKRNIAYASRAYVPHDAVCRKDRR